MDFRQLDYILATAKYRNITKAADSLYISQSALSHYIKNVEDELGVPLFDRSTNPLRLTRAGECYMESANRILLEKERLEKEIRDITNHMSGTIKLGTSENRCSYLIPKLLPQFRKLYPNIKVDVVCKEGQVLIDMLRSGELDLMLLPDLPDENNTQGLASDVLYSEEMLLAAAPGVIPASKHIGGHHVVNLKDVADIPFFVQDQGHVNRAFCDKLFKKEHIKPTILQTFRTNVTCYRMAATGTGIAIIPFMTTKLANPGAPVELFSIGNPPLFWNVRIYYRKDAYLGEPEKQLLALARTIFSREQRSPDRLQQK